VRFTHNTPIGLTCTFQNIKFVLSSNHGDYKYMYVSYIASTNRKKTVILIVTYSIINNVQYCIAQTHIGLTAKIIANPYHNEENNILGHYYSENEALKRDSILNTGRF
jgi:hypothetical protein